MKITKLLISAAALAVAATTWAADAIPTQSLNKELAARLPASVKEAGVLKNVITGTFSPYSINKAGKLEGATRDFAQALGEVLGVKVESTMVGGLPAVLLGLQSDRYDLSIEPVGDFKAREAKNDFVDYVREYVVFAVPKGNPNGIKDITDACGLKVSVMAGGSAERVIKHQSETCVKEGKKAITVLSFEGQAAPFLAVRSGRADAFFSSQAPLTYFVSQNQGKIELAAVGKANGFDNLYQGAVLKKDSPLTPVILDAFKQLHQSGVYEAIMKKWGLGDNMLDVPEVNKAGKESSTF